MDHQDLIQLVINHRVPIAAFATGEHEVRGRGVVLAHIDALNAAETLDASELRYVPLSYIPKADDFRPVIMEYDPSREFVILIGGLPDEGEALLRLAQSDDDDHADAS